MTRFLSTLAVAAFSATMVMADNHHEITKDKVEAFLTEENIEFDVETLTDEQLASLDSIFNGGGDMDSDKAAILAVMGLEG